MLNLAYGQHVPYGMRYQAVARDAAGQVLSNKEITLRISLVSNYTDQVAHYTETHKVTTSQLGLFTLVVGEGKVEKGKFKDIPWSTEDIWMQVEIKTGASANFITISSSKLLAVPYAFHAGTASELVGPAKAGKATGGSGAANGNTPGVPSQVWSLFGNSSVNSLTDFLGSTNYADLVMITNNLERLRITKDGDINIQNTLNVGNNVNIGNDLHVGRDATIDRNQLVKNDLTVDKNTTLNAKGGATVNNGPLTVANASPTVLTGTLSVDRATQLKNTLTVEGATDLNNALRVNNASPTTLSGTLRTVGATQLDNTLTVAGTTDLNSALRVNNASPTTLSGTLRAVGATQLDNTLTVTGASALNNTLAVAGATDLNSALRVNNASPTTLSGTLHTVGATQLDNTLTVTGASALNSTLAVTGASTLNNTLTVAGATRLNSTLNTTGAANLNSTLVVGGATTLNNTLSAKGQVTIDANVSGGDGNYAAYPLRVQGSDQGVAIKVNGGRNGSKDFVTFFDNDGVQGRIEGQTTSELNSDPEYIYDNSMLAANEAIAIAEEGMALADVAAALASTTPCVGLGVCETVPIPSLIAASVANAVIATANLAIASAEIVTYNTFRQTQIGVTYQSGAGDYAEWLPKASAVEQFHFGDVVGVKGGVISKVTAGAEKVMVISERPIVLGNMPEAGKEANYEKVAFMGQVPVKVIGRVQPGDYVLASGGGNGFGVAKRPGAMEAADYKRIVGIAWSASDREGVNHVNVAVGLNTNDIAQLVQSQESKISAQAAEIAALRAQINQTNSALATLVPGFREAMGGNVPAVAAQPAPVVATAPAAAPKLPGLKDGPLAAQPIRYNPLKSADIEAGFALAEKNLRERGTDVSKVNLLKRFSSDPAYKAELVQKMQTRYNNLIAELTREEARR
ncbi:autotransporter outer membrane beta-barrel domain-containing protein [Hymenobacter properus]|uniref:Peptidase S74 domain-containing protein n=1 Tax=Hymenobacter properus TaxID=2791026 RepID=A0A931BFF1_9BACT|nr:hypothetical protein [Hymenobacter properus]MBF9141302.1 hypothetical protein [Hymenobacter properus]MBR7720112.1 hypothetical protein [Microvirga sp. SRT04]